ncbi:hypothetical protein [Aeromonas jandaei]|uniref:hypothetical protein n=1 Tax=Aeromonas jandaei TaxID=650 RepID=UPI003B9E62C8
MERSISSNSFTPSTFIRNDDIRSTPDLDERLTMEGIPSSKTSEENPGINREEKIASGRKLLEKYGNVVFFVPNSPNYGEQAINLRAINTLRNEYGFNADKKLIILTAGDSKPFPEQKIKMCVLVRKYENTDVQFNEQEFLKAFACSSDAKIENNIITYPAGMVAMPISEKYDIEDALGLLKDNKGLKNIKLLSLTIGEGEGEEVYSNNQLFSQDEWQTKEFSFSHRQPEVETVKKKLLKLDPTLEKDVIFKNLDDKNEISKPMEGSTLILSGARDSSGSVCGSGFPKKNTTEILMGDKDHGGVSSRTVYVAGEERERLFPQGINPDAIYKVSINKDAIKSSTILSDKQKSNLEHLANSQNKKLYMYGFHQVPRDSREHLLASAYKGLEDGMISPRPILLIVGDNEIPNISNKMESTDIGDDMLVDKLNKISTTPLIVKAGRLPSDVNNLLITKSNLVLAEGKGTISICQQEKVKHLILPQTMTTGELLMFTHYHKKNQDQLNDMSKQLYGNGASQIINNAMLNESDLYNNMSDQQELLVETLAKFNDNDNIDSIKAKI